MELNNKILKQVVEAKYLTAENAWRYRSILRFFYVQYQKMKYWMYKEEVYVELKNYKEFKDYTMDQCKQDLDVLSEWKNLIPVQDTSKAATVEEFKNKQFRYQLSEYTVEIERMLINLENLKVESASLEPSLLERLRDELRKFKDMVSEDSNTVGTWWNSLNEDFKRLNQNYQDYIRDLYSIKAEEMMKTKEFLVFKDKFIEYLRSFIKRLQENSYAIEAILKDIDESEEAIVLEKAYEYQLSIPRIDMEISVDSIKENINGRWDNLKKWFLSYQGHQSESAKLFDITNEIIRKITRFAFQIVETRNSASNRKEEYRKLCSLFLECRDIDDAHKLSSLSFGIFHTKHIKGNIIRETESINSGVFDEAPHEVITKPRIRTYREKRDRSSIPNNSLKKERLLQQVMKKRKEEEKIIQSYIKENKIDFEKLPKIESHVRITLLKWLSKANNSVNKRAKTEDGRIFMIYLKDGAYSCTLNCEDGQLQMPAYVIEFE